MNSKALEIILTKKVNIEEVVESDTWEDFNENYNQYFRKIFQLTKEEYNLIWESYYKVVLKEWTK